ncbi:bilirubin oxidase [Paraburkholderia caballeronis]|uniref:multicopper oxidase family protein n=1 Tax=Paraburkholderia caballeronis TaxID=416943 RepID=UPI00106574C7|nr:multicopper oxidase family protein [Paraburkholderia caballeronis]TDV35261.1 bilirubin oxidase [Paraburkholderia caballeronis]
MIRREFLVRGLGAAAASMFARSVFAQAAAQSMPMGDMPMHGMHDMHDMASMSGGMSMQSPLAAPDALPSGAPLPALRRLANESREPGLFRATLVAQPVARQLLSGQPATQFWQYGDDDGGPVIGPLIDVNEGDTVEIRFVNRLPQPSTIHWHGLPVPPDQDGNPSDPVAPGATRVYRFTLPAGSAGTYWYHPHPHMLAAEQVFRGLAGPIVVRAADDPLAGWPERHLLVSDLKLSADGTIPANGMMDWMNGREGQFVLVNGALRPRFDVNGTERWRVWNACSARYLRLTLGVGQTFDQIGTDGGLLQTPRRGLTELLLAPAERVELIVRAGAQPAQVSLIDAQYDRRKMTMARGRFVPPDADRVLADIRLTPAADARELPARLRTIVPFGPAGAQRSVVFDEAMDMHAMHQPGASAGGMPRGMKFMVNGSVFDPARITLTSRRGEVEHWTIENRTDMDHPFHLHGAQFQVISREADGKRAAEAFLAWRDTVNVRPGESVRIAVVQREAGDRMFHCHILEHESLGMMGTLRVV